MIDLDAYFARIDYTGSRAPTLGTLNALAVAHVQSIPFENVDVLRGIPIDLSPRAVEAKLVAAKRGGYCFEQNTLMLEVLTQLGFTVRPLSGRVRYQRPRDFTPARTHLFLRVELDESYLVDVGVGAMSVTCALRLNADGVQTTPHEPRRLLREGALIYDQVRFGDAWHDVKEFTLEEMPLVDRIVANWYTSAHPDSHFKNRLLVARAMPRGGRLGLLNRELSIRDASGMSHRRTIGSPDELNAVLAEEFGILVPPDTRLVCEGLSW